jgi:hypothetical protein
VLDDGFIIRKADKDEVPEDGFHLVCLMLSAYDYHFFRQDSDGTWSHKPGWDLVRGGIDDPVAYAREHTEYYKLVGFYLATSELKEYRDKWSDTCEQCGYTAKYCECCPNCGSANCGYCNECERSACNCVCNDVS